MPAAFPQRSAIASATSCIAFSVHRLSHRPSVPAVSEAKQQADRDAV
jgi:hypothetical protein